MENKKIEVKPVVSEKSYLMAQSSDKYTFMVDRWVSKIEAAKEIEKKYDVKVVKINSVVKPGKLKRNWLQRRSYRQSDMKKIIVTLKSGDKIDDFLKI